METKFVEFVVNGTPIIYELFTPYTNQIAPIIFIISKDLFYIIIE